MEDGDEIDVMLYQTDNVLPCVWICQIINIVYIRDRIFELRFG